MQNRYDRDGDMWNMMSLSNQDKSFSCQEELNC